MLCSTYIQLALVQYWPNGGYIDFLLGKIRLCHLRVEKNNRFDFFKKGIINFKLQENGCLVKNSKRVLNNFSFV